MLLLNKKIYVVDGKIYTFEIKKNVSKVLVYAGETSVQDGQYDDRGLITGEKLLSTIPEFLLKLIHSDEKKQTIHLSEDEKTAITNACAWVSSDETRTHVSGIFFDKESGFIVATDGRRLIRVTWKIFPENSRQFFFHPKAVALLKKKGATISFGAKGIYVNGKDGEFIYSTVVDGMFPRYQRIIPERDGKYNLEILDDTAFDIAKKVADKHSRQVLITPNGEVLTGSGPIYFTASKGMIKSTYPETIAFNVDFLIDAIKAGVRNLEGNGPTSPVTGCYTIGGVNYLAVIMPKGIE